MSFYDDASLMLLASGGAQKDGKVYSVKPTDGSGDFTFTRGSNLSATRVDASQLIEKGRENLILQSNQFDTTWSLSNTSVTSGQSGYDGSNDAWKINETANLAEHQLKQSKTLSGVHTLSIYAKAAERDIILFRMNLSNSWTNVVFNLTSGSVVSTGGFVTAKITSAGNGWYRCEAVFTNLTGSTVQYQLGLNDTTFSYLGEAGKGIYIQDTQLEIGLAATPYIETGATSAQAGILEDTPRFDYSGGATCPSLLLEPSRTNLIEYSEYLNSGWLYARSSSSLSLVVSPDGDSKSYKFIEILDTNKNFYIYQRPTSVSGQTYTQSIFAKAGERDWLKVELDAKYAYFDLTNGVIGSTSASTTANIEQLSNGWYRCSVSAITTSAAPYIAYYLAIADGDSVYDGDGTSGLYLWGGQYEQGSYATSYIPNHSGGTITRAADSAYKSGQTANIGQTEGTLFLEVKASNINSDIIGVNQNVTNGLQIFKNVSNFFKAQIYAGGTSISLGDNTSITDTAKVALVYKSGDSSLFVNGAQVQTSATTFTFSGALDLVQFQGNFFAGIGTNEIIKRYFSQPPYLMPIVSP